MPLLSLSSVLQGSLRTPGDEAPGGILHAEWGNLPRVNAQLCWLLFKLFGRERTYSSSYDPHGSSGFSPGSTLGSLMEYFCPLQLAALPSFSAGITSALGNVRLEQLECLMVARSRARAPAAALPLATSDSPSPGIPKNGAVLVPGTDHLPCAPPVPGWVHQPGPSPPCEQREGVQERNYSDF